MYMYMYMYMYVYMYTTTIIVWVCICTCICTCICREGVARHVPDLHATDAVGAHNLLNEHDEEEEVRADERVLEGGRRPCLDVVMHVVMNLLLCPHASAGTRTQSKFSELSQLTPGASKVCT